MDQMDQMDQMDLKSKKTPASPQTKYLAFFEKRIGGPGERGKTFFLVKKSFSSPPKPSTLSGKRACYFLRSRAWWCMVKKPRTGCG